MASARSSSSAAPSSSTPWRALNERERHILERRRLSEEPTTLEELSKVYGISRERVRQIEVRAFEKLRKAARDARPEARVSA